MCVPDEQGLGSWWITPTERDGFRRCLLWRYVLRAGPLLSTKLNSISFTSPCSSICDCVAEFIVESLPAAIILAAPLEMTSAKRSLEKGVNLKTVKYFIVHKMITQAYYLYFMHTQKWYTSKTVMLMNKLVRKQKGKTRKKR